jgi:hypothetical protein
VFTGARHWSIPWEDKFNPPYRTTDKIIVLYILWKLFFFHREYEDKRFWNEW